MTEFALEDGTTVLIESLEPESAASGTQQVGRADDLARRAATSLEVVLESARPAIDVIVSKLHAMFESADEVQVEFGLTLSGELGGIILKAGAEANFAVTLTWSRT